MHTIRVTGDRRARLPVLAAAAMLILSACGGGTASVAPASEAPATEAPATEAPASEAPASEAPAAMTAEELIAAAGKVDDASFCGTKPMTLGIHDGWA